MNTAIKRFFPVAMFMMVALCVPELALAAGADTGEINILRHSRRFFKCAYKALLPAAP